MFKFVVVEKNELINAMRTAFFSFENERNEREPRLYSINQVSKKLGKAHLTIKKMVQKKIIRSTKDGLITGAALDEYLGIR